VQDEKCYFFVDSLVFFKVSVENCEKYVKESIDLTQENAAYGSNGGKPAELVKSN